MAPVHEAARHHDAEELRRLLDAEPGLVNEEHEYDGRSPLSHACEVGSLEAVQLLLDRGADIEHKDSNGYTPLMDACYYYGEVEVVALLLARGADPSARGGDGRTALIDASSGEHKPGSDHMAVVQLLLKDGRVPVDACDSTGHTALCFACFNGYADRSRLLLVEGHADHTIANINGETPMVEARRHGHQDCVRLLEWYEGELEKAYLLGKARAVADARECISRAAEKVGARTEAEAQRAREEAAPVYLRGRVAMGEALPVVKMMEQVEEEDEECVAVCEFLVHGLKDDLVVEMMEGLRYR